MDDSSSDDELDDSKVTITKKSLVKALAMVKEDAPQNEEYFGGKKALKECQLPTLRAHNLCATAEIFTGSDNFAGHLLQELRVSFLTNNYPVAAKLLELLLQRATTTELPILWRSAVVLFLNKECSDQELLDEFLEMCADQRLPESKKRLIEMLVSLPGPELAAAGASRRLTRKEGSEVTDSRSVTENEDPDDPDIVF